ncbi:hypothetical protein BJ170DRAFT_387454 [Xylariales sp. AK1849]|nr:hypothetical protein BJ170DRAFT_387454 [Xylariales sp. AK1849]
MWIYRGQIFCPYVVLLPFQTEGETLVMTKDGLTGYLQPYSRRTSRNPMRLPGSLMLLWCLSTLRTTGISGCQLEIPSRPKLEPSWVSRAWLLQPAPELCMSTCTFR